MVIDILVEGVYFFVGMVLVDIGWKVLVVNLFDFVVMGVMFVWVLFVLILLE